MRKDDIAAAQTEVWVFDCDIDSEFDEYDGEEVTILDVSRNARR